MGPVERSITDKLSAFFEAQFLQVTNESFMHSVPEGSESHFKLVIVCDQFQGQRLVQRHQSIYRLLAEDLAGPIHALALHTYTISEWAEKNAVAPESPNCLGGSKAK
ncbi:MAG: BolA/IbaG family iron-sulfur metabolism protein [Porticoccaceae bacterium]|nr:BolA/IbaG family iron-sulfur metabolism protein [Porticoccaceae bacterium]